ncbi:MAG TPA: entericidin A/B family lipoprotein [Rhodocyclaceae bacterium]|nr:entericidin A/B family lipoprotein [Rhodocyclaceae bacterium]
MSKYWVLILMALSVAACNTVQGVGKDLKKGGEAIENMGKK